MSVFGNVTVADQWERIAFNALPGAFDPTMWAHNYLSQSNNFQLNVIDRNIYVSDGPESNLLGLAPNFGCCTANFPQAWPKFASSTWMRNGTSGFTCLSFVPTAVTLPGISITVDSLYPFAGAVSISAKNHGNDTISLYLRIPGWVVNGTLSVSGANVEWRAIQGHQLQQVNVVPGTLVLITIDLKMQLQPELNQWVNDAVVFSRGPIVFAVELEQRWTELKHYSFKSSDWSVNSSSEWTVAVVLDSVHANGTKWTIVGRAHLTCSTVTECKCSGRASATVEGCERNLRLASSISACWIQCNGVPHCSESLRLHCVAHHSNTVHTWCVG
jgi:hypothetical protein